MERFYSHSTLEEDLMSPSQFVTVHTIIEFGCGIGRDFAFFARYGEKVFAFDLSRVELKLLSILN